MRVWSPNHRASQSGLNYVVKSSRVIIVEGEAGIAPISRPDSFRPQDISEKKSARVSQRYIQAADRSRKFVSYSLPKFHIMSSTLSKLGVLADPKPHDHALPSFVVSTARGFLPRQDPIVSLPPEFEVLESILTRMPVETAAGTSGLLAKSEFGDVVLKELPDLTPAIEKYKDDLPLMNAIYRDYSFLASAYLLEPCHERFVKGESYGLGRQSLPRTIALPIVRVAEMLVVFATEFLQSFQIAFLIVNSETAPASGPLWNTQGRMRCSTIDWRIPQMV
jgi:hypothetical protein